jgi:hypothetical protein
MVRDGNCRTMKEMTGGEKNIYDLERDYLTTMN